MDGSQPMFGADEIAEAVQASKGHTYVGPLATKRLSECSRDELLVIAVNGWNAYRGAIDDQREIERLRALKYPTFGERFFGMRAGKQ